MQILITDDVHPSLITGLQNYAEVQYLPRISYAEVQAIIPDYDGLIVNSKILVDEQFLQLARQLRWVGRLGSGLDIIDLEACAARNIQVINSPEGNANAVGEHALGMLLSLLNKLTLCDQMVRSFSWDREAMRGLELDGKTVGVIGCGNTGSAFVKKLSGFEVRVLIYDKYKSGLEAFHPRQQEVTLKTLLDESEVISLHVPLTEETSRWIDRSFFHACKKNPYLISTCRGMVVVLEDLLEALKSGRIRGACLDVFENEKTASYSKEDQRKMEELTSLNNVVLSPHVAGWTIESKKKIAQILLHKLEMAGLLDSKE